MATNDSPKTTSGPVRAAIVGAGLMGWWHAHELVRAGGKLIAVADTNLAAAQRLAQAYRARAFPSIHEMLAASILDALHICTPLAAHIELATCALDAGLHVLVEKPLTPDAGSTAALMKKAERRHRLLRPVHQFSYQDWVHDVRERLTGLIPLVHMEMTAATAGAEGLDSAGRDRVIADILPHPLDLFQCFLPAGIDTVEWSVCHPKPGELRALGQSEGTALALNLSAAGRPTRNAFTLIGAGGSVQADLFHGFVVCESGRVSRAQKILRPFGVALRTLSAATLNLTLRVSRNEPAYPGLRELIRDFYKSIHAGDTEPPGPRSSQPQNAVRVARARDQILEKMRLTG